MPKLKNRIGEKMAAMVGEIKDTLKRSSVYFVFGFVFFANLTAAMACAK